MLEDYFEEEGEQQQPASAEVAITMASEMNPTAPSSVFFLQPKNRHSAPDVTWRLVSRDISQK
jgi:hypothetical protein